MALVVILVETPVFVMKVLRALFIVVHMFCAGKFEVDVWFNW